MGVRFEHMNPRKWSDEELMRRVVRGDQTAFELLYDRYAPSVLGVVTGIVRDPALGEEVLQEVFWRVWDRSKSFDVQRGKFSTWLFSIARRYAIDVYRRRKIRPQLANSEQLSKLAEMIPSDSRVSLDVMLLQQQEIVQVALQQLPPAQRTVIEMAYFEGKTRREIANETDVPIGTIHTRARLALRRLQNILLSEGWER